jgi:hypothetical protein
MVPKARFVSTSGSRPTPYLICEQLAGWGVLLVGAGVAFYAAKQTILERRRAQPDCAFILGLISGRTLHVERAR